MANTLGASAVLTGTLLSVNVEYGDDDFLHPEFVQRIEVKISNSEGLVLREMSTAVDGVSSDGEGKFRLGMVIDPVEKPSQVVIVIKTSDRGTIQAQVAVREDTKRAIQGS